MNRACPKYVSRYVWSRSRITTTLLRWSGCRASDLASLTLKEIRQAISDESFERKQKKTGAVRVILLCKRAIRDLEAVELDISEVFSGGDASKPLGSNRGSNKLLTKARWIDSLNKFIKPAKSKFNLVLSSHSFRVNYITSLLCSTPYHKVAEHIGHASTNTTVRYDRYAVDDKPLRKT